MTGRDGGRSGRAGFDRDRNERPRGNPRDRPPGGGFRDRDPAPGFARPWERRDDARPPRPSGDRPFDRPNRDDDVRVEHYYPEEPRPHRDERDGPARSGGQRDARFPPPDSDRFARAPRYTPPPAPAPQKSAPPDTATNQPSFASAAATAPAVVASPVATPPAERVWSQQHLIDSWAEEERLRGWAPSDDELREMVEDNIEADPQLNARDKRNVTISAAQGQVTLTGTVRSRRAKFAAGSDAFWTFGVHDVRNQLAIKERGPKAATQSGTMAVSTTTPVVAEIPSTPPSGTSPAPALSAGAGEDTGAEASAGTGDGVSKPAAKKTARARKAPTPLGTDAEGSGARAAAGPPAGTVEDSN